MRRPAKEEIAAAGRTVRDVIAPGLDVLFCGINPGLYTAAVGHNFARPGNRFWPTLHRAGFTPRQLRPDEERELLSYGCGITPPRTLNWTVPGGSPNPRTACDRDRRPVP